MEMLEGVEVSLIHGDAFFHDDFAHKFTVVATNDVWIIRGHGIQG